MKRTTIMLPDDLAALLEFERRRRDVPARAIVRAVYPGAVGAIRRLHATGYALRPASGEPSWELDGYLTGMRVRGCFTALQCMALTR